MIVVNPTTVSGRPRRLVSATLLAAAVALGAATVAYPAVAGAQPNVKQRFDDCMKNNKDPDHNKAVGSCCAQVGGWLVMDPLSRNVSCQDHKPTTEECADGFHVFSPACDKQTTPEFDPTMAPPAKR